MPHSLPLRASVLVVGAGAMGAGIAQVAAAAGHRVYIYDVQEGAAGRAITSISDGLEKAISTGRMTRLSAHTLLSNLVSISRLAEASAVDLIIEAIKEDFDLKRSVFIEIERVISPEAIVTTNTSSFSITALAAKLARPRRFAGLHFFNPATRMKLVEVIGGLDTDPYVLSILELTMANWGKTPIRAKSTPGFIVNRVARPFYAEGLRVLEETGSQPAALDAIMRQGAGFKMGPFELMDMIGNDVNYAVTCSVHESYYGDPKFTPSILQRELVDAGHLGRKTGRGFYDYSAPFSREVAYQSACSPPQDVAVLGDLGPAASLTARFVNSGISLRQTSGPGEIIADGVKISLTDGRTATERAHDSDHRDFVTFDYAADWRTSTTVAIAASEQSSAKALSIAAGLFQCAGMSVVVLPDIPGLLAMRTMVMLANEAAEATYRNVASAGAVDAAMCAGANYPIGPLEWADKFGLGRVLTVLDNLARSYGEDRYRASVLIRRAAFGRDCIHG